MGMPVIIKPLFSPQNLGDVVVSLYQSNIYIVNSIITQERSGKTVIIDS
jgi:hypothetical protein